MPPRKALTHRAAALAAFTWCTVCRAHGPPAAITGVAAASGAAPTVIQVSEGLALRDGGAFRYVCPVQFGNELSPPALSVDGTRTFVVGADDLFTLSADGTVTAEDHPEFSRQAVVSLSAVAGRLYGFRFTQGETAIVQIEPPVAAPLWSDTQPYDSLTPADDGFWMARAEGMLGHALHVDLSGQVADERTFPVEGGSIVGRVVANGGTLYVALVTGSLEGRLLVLGADGGAATLVRATAPVQGPVLLDGPVAVTAADGVLDALTDSGPSALGTSTATCIGSLGSFAWMCSRTKLFSLGAAGPGALLADLTGLQPPDTSRVDPAKRQDCKLQWAVFRNDLGRIGVATADADAGTMSADGGATTASSPTRATPRSSGCSVSGTRDGAPWSLWPWLALSLLGTLRRERRWLSDHRQPAPESVVIKITP